MCTSAPCVPTALGVPWGYSTTVVRVVGPRTEIGVTFLYPTPMGRALLARPPKRVWGVTRNVTDNSPTSIGTLCVAPWCPKHTGVSLVASAFAKSVTFRGTLLGLFCCFGAVWLFWDILFICLNSGGQKLPQVMVEIEIRLILKK